MVRAPVILVVLVLALLGLGVYVATGDSSPDSAPGQVRAEDAGAGGAQSVASRPELPPSMAQQLAYAQRAITGEAAREMVARMDPSYRVPGNRSFEAAIGLVVETLRAAGYEEVEEGAPGSLTFRIEHRDMDQPAWEAHGGSLQIVGSDSPLLDFADHVNLLAANSYPTPAAGVEAELVDVGSARPEDFEGVDVRGKIVLGDASAGQLFRRAVQENGAVGVLSYQMPAFNRPEVNRGVIHMTSIPSDPEARSWGLSLSRDARDALRSALADGPVRVRVSLDTEVYASDELTLVAEVRGSAAPDERFVFSAHVQESGANDNASGVAALAEIARAFGEGVQSGSFRPLRTITMIWGDEISSTRRYLQEDPARTEGVRFGMSLDMVGEDTEKTGGTFLIEKMPDPSAVWTRGDDHHTEWGGRPLTEDQLTPGFYNDFVLNRCLDQAAGTGWVVRTNPFEGGSDHVPFLQANVPGILLWHFTDQFYHTDGDRLEMVSATTLKNVSVCAATSAMALTTADEATLEFLADELARAASDRIEREAALSRAALASGEALGQQRRILQSWTDWYVDSVGTLTAAVVGQPTAPLEAKLEAVREAIADTGARAIQSLEG